MALRPEPGTRAVLKGSFDFSAEYREMVKIQDSYDLLIRVPAEFPRDLPSVMETSRRIPRDGKHHVNQDGTLCLGGRPRLILLLSKTPTLIGYAENCLVPYLYNMSHKLKYGGSFPFDDLAHGFPGELEDCADLFNLKSSDQAKYALELLGIKKRHANKYPCPCGCRLRLGRCRFNSRLREFRQIASRSWFRSLGKSK